MDGSPEQRRLREQRSRTFGGVAGAYERTRPGYPERATRWLVGERPARVLELGAGTGKLTSALVDAGHDVTATEPSTSMLIRLAARLDVPCVQATAEALPFPANSFDVVVAAQAFHWFDLAEALPAIARVLRDDGTLSLAWNLRDETIPWTRRLTEIIGSESHDLSVYADELAMSGLFSVPERAAFGFWQQLDLDSLLGLVESRSYVASLGQGERDAVLDRVRTLYGDYTTGRNGLRLRYATHCYRATVDKSALPGDPEPPGGGDLLFDFR
ncbi:MAG: class I SAM-dependent methyltransferase [Nocardioidaceae bacterium]